MSRLNHKIEMHVVLRSSRLFKSCLLTMYCLAVWMIVISALTFSLKFLISLILMLMGCLSYQKLKKHERQSRQIRFGHQYGWQISKEKNSFDSVEILADTWMCTWLIVLNFRHHKGTDTWSIFKDSMQADEFRRLRVCLQTQFLKKKGGAD